MKTAAGDKWRGDLAAWGIPKEILDQAPENPWIHPPAVFALPSIITDSFSHQRAREVLPKGGSVLDVGCGGGIAAFALTPPAASVIGVDHQSEMLTMFSEHAHQSGVESRVYEGFWPEVAKNVPIADVAVSHHVLYNVQEIEDFLLALDAHARTRVVLELPQQHPKSSSSALWEHFWGITRPSTPTPHDAMKVIESIGIVAKLQLWSGEMRSESDLAAAARNARISLCLPESRESEVLDLLTSQPVPTERKLATIWWDVEG